ncbi:MAG: VOC family protein [Burkholderiales bacterium]|nr:VOC family protein [Burkholderiales bacterium]
MISLDHTILRVRDCTESVSFYRDILGLRHEGRASPFEVMRVHAGLTLDLMQLAPMIRSIWRFVLTVTCSMKYAAVSCSIKSLLAARHSSAMVGFLRILSAPPAWLRPCISMTPASTTLKFELIWNGPDKSVPVGFPSGG